jgi:RTX calcium-binding nonapeptide repeat (4 copies)
VFPLCLEKIIVVTGRSLGIGLNGIADYSTELPFLDAFKSARSWTTQNSGTWDTGESAQLNVDAQGWVKSLPTGNSAAAYRSVGTLLLREIPGAYPSGRYVVFYDGTGTIEYNFDATKNAAESTPGRDVLQVDSNGGNGIYLKITATDPNNTGDYIRNIRVYREADLPLVEMGMQFNPDFIQKIKEFGTLRYMDWMQTNGSLQKEWSDRPTLDSASWAWSKEGAPVELMVALANETGTSPWFNMPHQATDEYMAKFAAYVRDNLDPNLKAYVEFSNEVWNGQFPQFRYAQAQSDALFGTNPVGGGGWMQWYGVRTAQMSQIWKNTFGNQRDRVVAVASSQAAFRGLEEYILNTPAWVAQGNQPAKDFIDAYGITGYFGNSLGDPSNANTVRSWLAEPDGGFTKAFQQLTTGGLLAPGAGDSVAGTIDLFKYHAAVAQRYGKQLVAYEGGQHVVGVLGVENDQQLTDFFIALNRRPEMGQLYTQLLNGWRQSGGTLFNYFLDVTQPTKYGSWGALENLNQTTSPKYAALQNFIATNDRWWNEPTSAAKVGLFQRGTAGNDSIAGGGVDDTLLGGNGDDRIVGNNGRDRLHGEVGNDQIDGSAGDDRLGGGSGVDTLLGGTGNDLLAGGMSSDTLTGGGNADRFIYSAITRSSTSKATALSTSLAAAPDRITDFRFSQNDKIQIDDRNPATSDLPSGLFNAGTKVGTTLTDAVTAAYVDKNRAIAGSQAMQGNEAVFLTWNARTYLAVNNGSRSYEANQDAVVDMTGIGFKTGDATLGTLAVGNYFA